jgi:hypothetical protein
MPGFAAGVLLLLLIAAIVGGSLVIGAPVFAVPIVFLVLVVWAGARMSTRRGRPGIGEEDVRAERIEFDARDRETLTPPEQTPRAGGV